MTFYDPASIECDCDTRGRNRRRYRIKMLSNIILCYTLINTRNLVYGVPVTEDPINLSTTLHSTITTEIANSTIPIITTSTETLHDEMITTTTAATTTTTATATSRDSTSTVIFVDIPKDTETSLGTSVLLECRTAHPVADCQWSWQPLPPVNLPLPDINPQINSNETAAEIATVSSTTAVAQALPLRQFPAFGNNSNDCSVRFTQTNYKQIGYWTCAARISVNDTFISSPPAMLSITNDKSEPSITFSKMEDAQEAAVESSAEIQCRTENAVKECQWSWRLFNQTEVWNLEIQKFPAFGENNTDCSIKFKNVLRQQEGLWTCGARTNLNGSFIQAKPVRFFVSEVEFIQLSRGIQTAAGESALLRCLVNKPVVQCEWSWKPLNSSKVPMVKKDFVPNDDNKHDCSVRFKNVLYEDEGLWTCSVRLTNSGRVHEAAPTTLTLLPSAKVTFVETPVNKSIAVASAELLTCTANSRIEKCSWLWHSLDEAKVSVKYEFPGAGNLGRNCSLYFSQIRIEDQGYWACQLSVSSTNTIVTSGFAKIIVYNQEKVEFSELSQDIQMSSGSSVSLRCVTSSAVEQCRWSLTPVNSNTTVVVRQFTPVGSAGRDCSVRLSHALAEQEGLWTCGVKVHGATTYMNASPAKLSLLEPEPVIVTIVADTNEKVNMGCKLNPVPLDTKCRWIRKSSDPRKTNDTTAKLLSKYELLNRQHVRLNYTSGICTLQFKPDRNDLGLWMCQFIITINETSYELGNATLNLLTIKQDDGKLGWIVGTVTTLILFLMILIVVLVVCKTRLFTKKSTRVFETAPTKSNQCLTNSNNNHDLSTLQLSESSQATNRHTASLNSLPTFSSNEVIYKNPEYCNHNMDRGQYHTSCIYERFSTS